MRSVHPIQNQLIPLVARTPQGNNEAPTPVMVLVQSVQCRVFPDILTLEGYIFFPVGLSGNFAGKFSILGIWQEIFEIREEA